LSDSPLKEPLNVKLRCKSWAQVRHLYERDIKNGQLFLKASKPPPLHTRFEIALGLPSESSILLRGRVNELVPEGGMDGRGPGVILVLDKLPANAQSLLEGALKTASKGNAASPADAASESSPSVSDGEDIAAAEEALVGQLRSELAALAKLNPFQLLDLDYDADEERIRAAFAELTKRYHPDRFARYQSSAIRNVGAEVYLLVRNAYKELCTEEGRERVRAAAGAHPVAANPTTTNPPAPEMAPSQPAAAPAASAPAPESDPIGALLTAKRYPEALEQARAAAARESGDAARAMVELCEGLIALEEGDRMEAAERLEASLELAPDNEHAIRGLAEIRRRITEERKGFLGRLLDKKD